MSDGNLVRAVVVSNKLKENLQTLKRLLGPDLWAKRKADYAPHVRAFMKRYNTSSPIAAVLPVATAMSKAGDDPTLLIAVATELCEEPDTAEAGRAAEVGP